MSEIFLKDIDCTYNKNFTAKEIYRHHPEVRKVLLEGYRLASGYYINTVAYGNEEFIRKYAEKY